MVIFKFINDAFRNVDAALFLTEWNEFQSLQWCNLSKLMRKPAWVFDTRSIVNIKEAQKYGMKVWQVGFGN